jgi:hypothetical protein
VALSLIYTQSTVYSLRSSVPHQSSGTGFQQRMFPFLVSELSTSHSHIGSQEKDLRNKMHCTNTFVKWLKLPLSKGTNRVGFSFPSPEDGNISSFRSFVLSSICIWNSGRWTKSRNPVILSVIHHRQNPSDSNQYAVFLDFNKDSFYSKRVDVIWCWSFKFGPPSYMTL